MQESLWIDSRGQKIFGLLEYDKPEEKGKNLVIFFHGFTGLKSAPHRMFRKVSELLSKKGYTVLRFDFIGSGDSEGDFEDMTISREVEDGLSVLKYCNENFKIKKLYFIGYSLGGCIATILTSKSNCDGLVLWSPASNPFWNFHNIFGEENFINGLKGEKVECLGNVICSKFFDELPYIDPSKSAKEYENKVLLIQGTKDEWIMPINAFYYKKMFKNCSIHFIEGADHDYTSYDFEKELIDKTVDFLVLEFMNQEKALINK
ncbi:MAG: alpha/beta hydrolase family protein [Sedimentibacter sp.]